MKQRFLLILLFTIPLVIGDAGCKTPHRTESEEAELEAVMAGTIAIDWEKGDYYYDIYRRRAKKTAQRSAPESARARRAEQQPSPAGKPSSAGSGSTGEVNADKVYPYTKKPRDESPLTPPRVDGEQPRRETGVGILTREEFKKRLTYRNAPRKYIPSEAAPEKPTPLGPHGEITRRYVTIDDRKRTIMKLDYEQLPQKDETGKPEVEEKAIAIPREEIEKIDTHQFTLIRGLRIRGFNTINCPGKDYSLLQDPTPGSQRYFFLSDRTESSFGTAQELTDMLAEYGNELAPAVIERIKNAMSQPREKGNGLLEIMSCDSVNSANGEREVLFNPRFTDMRDMTPGDKLGFALFHNAATGKLEVYYSAGGDLHLATSSDGERFDYVRPLTELNSNFIERDPTITQDGSMIAFASSRNIQSDIAGVELFIAVRENAKYFKPAKRVPHTYNPLSSLFPSFYQNREGTFILLKRFFRRREYMASLEIRDGVIKPIVNFTAGSDMSEKYLAISASDLRGLRILASYQINGYDLFRMDLKSEKITVDAVEEE